MIPTSDDPTTVTDAQRAYILDALTNDRDSIRQAVSGLTDAQLHYKPAPDRWSIAECVEHVAVVETGMFAGILKGLNYPANPEKRSEIRVSDVDVIKSVRSRKVTLSAPDPVVPTGRFDSVSAALDAFGQQRDTAIAWAKTRPDELRTHYFRHIAFGWIDSYQALLVLAAHPERHRKQIEEVKVGPGFPA